MQRGLKGQEERNPTLRLSGQPGPVTLPKPPEPGTSTWCGSGRLRLPQHVALAGET